MPPRKIGHERPNDVTQPNTFSYGFISPGLFAQIKARFLELARAKQRRAVRR